MNKRLVSHSVRTLEDIRDFFDSAARAYSESHGAAAAQLDYRVALLRALFPAEPAGVLVEIGCGPGDHLFTLAPGFDRAIGLDLSPGMIARATENLLGRTGAERISLAVDDAERLTMLGDRSVDVLFCVGALEHMLHKGAVMRGVQRALKPGGIFVCLTLNGGYLWYTALAHRLGFETRHLCTDRRSTERELREMLESAGLRVERTGFWTFIPRGDMPWIVGQLLAGLDRLGHCLNIPSLRGGIWFKAQRAD
jgi:2-polyprenyl-6-hydroxyphenyl methylase/3-demethylubiquinone-9 3-methyltransferase